MDLHLGNRVDSCEGHRSDLRPKSGRDNKSLYGIADQIPEGFDAVEYKAR